MAANSIYRLKYLGPKHANLGPSNGKKCAYNAVPCQSERC